jgi:hypothetical protein
MNLTKNKKTSKKNNYNFEPAWQLNLTKDQIRKLIENEKEEIKVLGEWYIKYHENQSKISGEIEKYKQENSHLTMEEILPNFFKMGQLSMEESLERYKETINIGSFINFIGANKHKLIESNAFDKMLENIEEDIESDEFPVVKIVADQINNISKMLEKFEDPIETNKKGIYIICSEIVNSKGNNIELQYQYPALDIEEAKKIKAKLVKDILGEVLRATLACWAMVGDLGTTYKCRFTKIMEKAFPGSKTFSAPLKAKFYAALEHGDKLKFIYKKKDRGKEKQIHIPLVKILETEKAFTRKDLQEKYKSNNKKTNYYPTDITLSVLHNPLYDEKLYQIFVGIKKSFFELPIDDQELAVYIEIRKHQLMEQKYIKITRSEAIKKGKLDGINHSGMANKKLLNKFERLKLSKIIISYPKKITEVLKLKIR